MNNAGGHSKTACGLLGKASLAGWPDFIEANLTGTFLMLRAYARLMMPQHRGSVVNIASMEGVVGRERGGCAVQMDEFMSDAQERAGAAASGSALT